MTTISWLTSSKTLIKSIQKALVIFQAGTPRKVARKMPAEEDFYFKKGLPTLPLFPLLPALEKPGPLPRKLGSYGSSDLICTS